MSKYVLALLAACTSTNASAPDGGADAAAAPRSCDEISQEATAEIHTAEVRAANDLTCGADGDCRYVFDRDRASACAIESCGYVVENVGGAAAVAAVMQQVGATLCAPFFDAGCHAPVPPPCPFPPNVGPFCNGGMCSDKPPLDAGAGD